MPSELYPSSDTPGSGPALSPSSTTSQDVEHFHELFASWLSQAKVNVVQRNGRPLAREFLTLEQRLLLEQHVSSTGPVTKTERKTLSELLDSLWQRELWVSFTREALHVWYTVVQRSTGTAHMRAFRVSEPEPDGFVRHLSPAIGGTLPSPGNNLGLHRPFAEVVFRGADTCDRTHRFSLPVDQVAGLLLSSVQASELNTYAGELRSRALDSARLARALSTFGLAPGISASGWCECPLLSAALPRLEKRIMDAGATWPTSSRPYALVTLVAAEISDLSLTVVGQGQMWTLPLCGTVHRFGDIGPWLVLGTYAEDGEHRGSCGVLRAYAHPLLSTDCWLPVDSGYERRVATWIRALVGRCRNRGWPVRVSKPIRDLDIPDATGIRPDFILTWEGRPFALMIEVLGSHDPEYRGKKLRDQEVIERFASYLPVDAARADDDGEQGWLGAYQDFEEAVCRWLVEMRAAL